MLKISLIFLITLVPRVVPNPLPGKHYSKSDNSERILYDQRQEGDWNIRADLKNFVILIVPKTGQVEAEEPQSPTAGLLDFFTKSHTKHPKKQIKNQSGGEALHFIESKTAPYHVDITKSSGSHLMNEEILATQTPPVVLPVSKSVEAESNPVLRQLRSTRFNQAFVLTVPDEEFVLTKMEDKKKVVKKDGFKKKIKEEMMLLGAVEQCGPDMFRDAEGVCRFKKVLNQSNESVEK
ncbi:hypothetical protein ABEB36_012470 [Hypothenemus hampei]|uniref:Uncharacterized protein n=1 Tax=Hypothenemus hampei TaxID=57062 RepID=A0ABD1EC32_HYPHA